MAIMLFLIFFTLIILNVPVAFSLGIASLIVAWLSGLPLELLPQRLFVGSDTFVLICIPFFVMAGEIMNHGKVTDRIFRFSESLIGHITGSLAHLNVLVSMIFAGITGAAVADTSAIGSMIIPQMINKGYKKDFIVAVTAASSVIGVIIPPSIPMILIGSISGVSVARLFIGGILPGIIFGLGQMIFSYFFCRRQGFHSERRFNLKEVLSSFRYGVVALAMPVIIIGGIVSGLFTPTEAGAIAAFYGLIVSKYVLKTLKVKDVPRLLYNTVLGTAGVMLVVATASLYGWLVTYLNIHVMVSNLILSVSSNYYFVLFACIVIYLIAGLFLDMSSNIILLYPVLYPLAMKVGIDPVHFGLITVVALAIGLITPPTCVCAMVACDLAKIKLMDAFKQLMYFVGVGMIVLVILALVPSITTFLPKLVGR